MKNIFKKVGTICLFICMMLAVAFFCYMLVFEGTNIAW